MKYNYQILDQAEGETDAQMLARVNDLAEQGYRFISEHCSDKGRCRVFLEKQSTTP